MAITVAVAIHVTASHVVNSTSRDVNVRWLATHKTTAQLRTLKTHALESGDAGRIFIHELDAAMELKTHNLR